MLVFHTQRENVNSKRYMSHLVWAAARLLIYTLFRRFFTIRFELSTFAVLISKFNFQIQCTVISRFVADFALIGLLFYDHHHFATS